jgi:uncharacterized cupredoxin-like copper-binding protein
MKKLSVATFLISGLLASIAFAHDDEHAGSIGKPGDPKSVSRIVKVKMSDAMRFEPSSIAVKKNETIRFVVSNGGKLKHEMVLGNMAELKKHAALMMQHPEMEHTDPNQVSVLPGKTGELIWQFTKAGKVDFACLEPGHFEAGMVGKVAVK